MLKRKRFGSENDKEFGLQKFLGKRRPRRVDPLRSKMHTEARDLPHSDQTIKGLSHLGYKHIVWNWCTEVVNGQNGKRHYGTAIMSKYRLDDIECQMATGPDAQGRVTTASIGNATLVCTYVPCARLNGGPEKSLSRKDSDEEAREIPPADH